MVTDDLVFESAFALVPLIRSGEVSSESLTRSVLDRIHSSELNAFALVMEDTALDAARRLDDLVRSGSSEIDRLPMLGVPISVKDNIETAGARTTYGSRVFADHVPVEDAVVVQRLRAAGAVIVGKTTLPEFATKGVVDSPLLGMTRNPWDRTKVVGGSSGGAAVAVAAGMGPIGIGNDQAGSVRMPAALCGVLGLKPTGGRVPFAPNPFPWDQIFHVGMLARTVDDIELSLGVVEGTHPDDPMSVPPTDPPLRATVESRRLKVGWSPRLGFARIEPEVLSIVEAALHDMTAFADIEDVDIDLSAASPAYAAWVPFKRSIEVGDRLDEWEPLMDPEVVAYIRSGAGSNVDGLREAYAARTAVYRATERALAAVDLLITPTLSVAAFEIGLTRPSHIDGVETTTFRDWFPYTYPFNLSGHPAISIPAGMTAAGLPVGIQIVGPRFADRELLAVARQLERLRQWAALHPPLH